MADYIDRQQAIDALTVEYMSVGILGEQWAISRCIDAVKKLPSAEREGLWVESNPQNSEICRLIKCSECGKGYIVGFNVSYAEWTERHKFCVECGARMEVEHE